MTLFKVSDREETITYLGVNINREMHNHFRLAAINDKTTMTRIVRKKINAYLKKQPTFNELFPLLANTVLEEWDKLCISNTNKRGWKSGKQLSRKFDVFIETVKNKLKRKRIPKHISERLIQTIEQQEINRLEDGDIL